MAKNIKDCYKLLQLSDMQVVDKCFRRCILDTINNATKDHIMHNHQYTYKPTSKPSKAQDIIITVSCLAVFALWGVLLALGV